MTQMPEFSRPERIDTIGDRERGIDIVANTGERAALATRFALVSIDRLDAHFDVRGEAAGIRAVGRVRADIVQQCSVTGDPLPAAIDEPVALLFVDEAIEGEEIELSGDALDTMPIASGMIDLGEAAAETLALSLDPFPRGPGAVAALKAAGVIGEDEAGPFGALAGLKAKLDGG